MKRARESPAMERAPLSVLKMEIFCYTYTEYYGEDWADHAIAHICACISSDEGESFADRAFLLEDDLASTYCYPAITQVKDGFLVAYYHSNGGDYTLNCLKITKVYFEEIAK